MENLWKQIQPYSLERIGLTQSSFELVCKLVILLCVGEACYLGWSEKKDYTSYYLWSFEISVPPSSLSETTHRREKVQIRTPETPILQPPCTCTWVGNEPVQPPSFVPPARDPLPSSRACGGPRMRIRSRNHLGVHWNKVYLFRHGVRQDVKRNPQTAQQPQSPLLPIHHPPYQDHRFDPEGLRKLTPLLTGNGQPISLNASFQRDSQSKFSS